jgi:hypothetical protein
MKKKASSKKLTLNKRSIANLTQAQMSSIRAGNNLATQTITNSNLAIDCTTRPTSAQLTQ